jgi:hypothetical protein
MKMVMEQEYKVDEAMMKKRFELDEGVWPDLQG